MGFQDRRCSLHLDGLDRLSHLESDVNLRSLLNLNCKWPNDRGLKTWFRHGHTIPANQQRACNVLTTGIGPGYKLRTCIDVCNRNFRAGNNRPAGVFDRASNRTGIALCPCSGRKKQ